LINQVKVVFSTISNFVINPRLKDGDFDNLIVDEASMLALPQLIALARKVTKRIILVGDFQQLSPITVAGVPLLKDNVFKLCGIDIDHTSHPALRPLLNQRRSNPKLVDIINNPFYAGHLQAKNKKGFVNCLTNPLHLLFGEFILHAVLDNGRCFFCWNDKSFFHAGFHVYTESACAV
jgi:superfamily I DNA and/or RNA helicase